MMVKRAVEMDLTNEERKELESLGQSRKTAQACRARIVLAAEADQQGDKLKMTGSTVGKWRRRFAELRLDGLYDEPRPGASRRRCRRRASLEETPPGATHWSLRSRAVGYVSSTICWPEIPPQRDLQAGSAVR